MGSRRWLLAGLSLLAGFALPVAPAAPADREETVIRVLGDDTFAAGSHVRLAEDSPGDAIAVGADLSFTGGIDGDAVAAGRQLSMRSAIGGDFYGAGAEVRIEGPVAGNARVAGGRVELGPAGEVAGGMSAAGGSVRIEGRVGRYLQVTARETQIDGRVGGEVMVRGRELRIGPQAVIDGSVTFHGPEPPDVAATAQVRDGVRHVPGPDDEDVSGAVGKAIGVGALLWMAGWIIVGSLLIALLPGATRVLTGAVRARPGWSMLGGLALLIGVPVLILILLVTVIGMPLGLVLLAFYLVWLPLGYMIAAAALGEWGLSRLRGGREATVRWRISAFIVALIVLALVAWIPLAGQIVVALVLLAGVGSIVAALAARRARAAPA